MKHRAESVLDLRAQLFNAEAEVKLLKKWLEAKENAKRVVEQQLEDHWLARRKAEAEIEAARPLLKALQKCAPEDIEWEAEGTDWLEKSGTAVRRFLTAALAYRESLGPKEG